MHTRLSRRRNRRRLTPYGVRSSRHFRTWSPTATSVSNWYTPFASPRVRTPRVRRYATTTVLMTGQIVAVLPYRWFSDMQGCEDAQAGINTNHPADVKIDRDDAFTSDCVPASKVSGRALKGYEMVFALSALDGGSDIYADLRQNGQIATVFKTFDACYDVMDTAY